MPFLEKRGLVLAKIESTYGVDPTPTAAANAILASNPSVRVDGRMLTREYLESTISRRAHVMGRVLVDFEFTTELKGSGAAGTAPEIGVLWRAAGHSETIVAVTSVTYQQISATFESITVWIYMDGIIHKITGCYVDYEIILSAGGFGSIRWRGKGLYNAPVDGAVVAGTFQTTKPVVIGAAATLSLGGYAAIVESLQLRGGLGIEERLDMNAADGLKALQIVSRDVGGSVNPEAVTEATHTFWANFKAGTEVALAVTVGSVAGNIFKVKTASKVQYGAPAWGARGGNRIYDLPLHVNRVTEAGNDEALFEYT